MSEVRLPDPVHRFTIEELAPEGATRGDRFKLAQRLIDAGWRTVPHAWEPPRHRGEPVAEIPWSEDDDARLLRAIESGGDRHRKNIARRLGRTEGAVLRRIAVLVHRAPDREAEPRPPAKPPDRGREPWTPAEDALLVEMRRRGRTFRAIGDELGRSAPVVGRRYRTRLRHTPARPL